MYGAILGDMVGAPYEFDRGNKSKEFEMWNDKVKFTDDSVMTIAVAEALIGLKSNAEDDAVRTALIKSMQKWGHKYPWAGYGQRFFRWLGNKDPQPYGSFGNGSAMRVSSVGWLYNSLEETRRFARLSAEVTHNHPEGIKGAEAIASAIYMARKGASKEEIKEYIIQEFEYDLSRTCDEIRPGYFHVESCQQTVPEALTAFFEGETFEDVIRTAVSLGGDCDTLTCIAGSIAEAFYGIPMLMEAQVKARINEDMLCVLDAFDERRGRTVRHNEDEMNNAIIEHSISEFHKEASRQNLGLVMEAIYNRMVNDARWLVPVIPQQSLEDLIDLDNVSVGDVVTIEAEQRFKYQHLETEDGRSWIVGFTSDEEYQKGQSSNLFTMVIRDILVAFSDEEFPEDGVVINPWGESFLLTKELMTVILKMEDLYKEEK